MEQTKEIFTTELISARLKEIIDKRTKKRSNPEAQLSDLRVLLASCKDSELNLQIFNLLTLLEIENSKDLITVVMPWSVWLGVIGYLMQTLELYSLNLPLPQDLDETRRAIIMSLSIRVERLYNELMKAFKFLTRNQLITPQDSLTA